VIDLHTHTTASDGRCTSAELISRAASAGVRVLSVTDHDTVAGAEAAAAACATAGIEFVSGIEISAMCANLDVHVLGYFFDCGTEALEPFLAQQRLARINRVYKIVERLRGLGMPLDADAVLRPGLTDRNKAAGRPWIARALVEAGYVKTTRDAFDKWLATDRPAFIPRPRISPEDVIGRIHDAGGIASLAHPGLLGHDEWIPRFCDAGLDAVEAYHSDHDAETTLRYVDLAARLDLVVSGGSDYHADDSHGGMNIGGVNLPPAEFDRLRGRGRQVTA
jgi:3',5'-nucleoside bisphosphate phosphatase